MRAWVLEPGTTGRAWRFVDPRETLTAAAADEVAPALAAVEGAVAAGAWAVGWLAYEAAPGLDSGLTTTPPAAGRPLVRFGLFAPPESVELPVSGEVPGLPLAPDWGRERHADAVAAIRRAIAEGETYQVNLTFPTRAIAGIDPEALFLARAARSRATYATFVDDGELAVVSLSPELFFERAGAAIRMRPMKGTRPRGRDAAEDAARAAELHASEKDRSENLMIVDMVRHDLGRIARPGSVRVDSLFDLERYPTVWQMTSSVAAESDAGLLEVFRALFPCASVTGAPKRRTMEWIGRLEGAPRGVYCGAIGWAAPDGRARFAVAIRTATVDRATGEWSYPVGSGIVWDSEAGDEYAECLVKARALSESLVEPAGLFETMLWEPATGLRRRERHLARLAASAAYFDLAFEAAAASAALDRAIAALPPRPHRVRLELAPAGAIAVACAPFVDEPGPWKAIVFPEAVDSTAPALFHKTTRRALYDRALAYARARGADEALLVNERGELTEATRANLVVDLDGVSLTPPLDAGLLPGVFRQELLDGGLLREATLRPADLARAARLRLVNSLRGWIDVELVAIPAEASRLP